MILVFHLSCVSLSFSNTVLSKGLSFIIDEVSQLRFNDRPNFMESRLFAAETEVKLNKVANPFPTNKKTDYEL